MSRSSRLAAASALADDRFRSPGLDDAQQRCYALESQFDRAVREMKASPAMQSAKALRVKGENQCDTEEDLDSVKQGVVTLEQALKSIGQSPE